MSKSDQSCNYNDNNIDNKNSDDKESDQKLSENTHLVLLIVLQQSDSFIYSEAILNAQNAHINNEISFFSDEVFATKKQLADLCMKNFIESVSYKKAMNSLQYDY